VVKIDLELTKVSDFDIRISDSVSLAVVTHPPPCGDIDGWDAALHENFPTQFGFFIAPRRKARLVQNPNSL
jgi:hypothetical protein